MLNDGSLLRNASHPIGPAWVGPQATASRSPTSSNIPMSQEDLSEAALRDAIESLCSGNTGGAIPTNAEASAKLYSTQANSWQSAGVPKEVCSTPSTVADVLLAAPPGYRSPSIFSIVSGNSLPRDARSAAPMADYDGSGLTGRHLHHQLPLEARPHPYWSSGLQSPNCGNRLPVSEASSADASQPKSPWALPDLLQSLGLEDISHDLNEPSAQDHCGVGTPCAMSAPPVGAYPKTPRPNLVDISSSLLAPDTRSEVMSVPFSRMESTVNSEIGSPSRGGAYAGTMSGYSASLVVPTQDRFGGRFIRTDDVSSSLLGSDVPTELKLDSTSCVHPEGHTWYAYKKKLLTDSMPNDDDEDSDESDVDDNDEEPFGEGKDSGSTTTAACKQVDFSGRASHKSIEPVKEPTTPCKSASSSNAPVHSVPPASLACRKRLTLTGSRGTKCFRKLMNRLQSAVEAGDWDQALAHTRTFAMCNESDSDDEANNDFDDCGSESGDLTATIISDNGTEPNDYEVADDCDWPLSKPDSSPCMMLRPSDVMNYCDFVNMCASCFHGLPSQQVGPPESVSDASVIRDGAKDIRQLLCDVETILLMCLASKVDLEPSEKLKLKNVVASLVFLLAWHPAMIEAIAVIFVKLQSQTNNDCFCSFLSRWTFTTNAIQILFEVFCSLLIREKRYLAFLLVLSATERGGPFIKPLLADPEIESQIASCLPEAGPILGAHGIVIESLRVPSYAVSIFLHDFILASSSDVEKPLIPHLSPETVILSIMPLIMARPFSDEVLISRGWHYRLMLFGPPVSAFTPEEISELLRAQTRQTEINLLTELEFGARAVVMHAVPHYLLLGSKQIRDKAYEMLEQQECPSYFENLRPILRGGGPISQKPSDHPVGHLPFERLYRNAMVKAGGYFLAKCIKQTVDSPDSIVCPMIIMQHLTNDVIEDEPTTADFNLDGGDDSESRRIYASEGLWWLRDDILPLITYLHDDLNSGRRAYQIQELMSRLTERFFVTSSGANGYISPFEEAVNSCNSHPRVPCGGPGGGGGFIQNGGGGGGDHHNGGHQLSYLQIVKRTMLEHTGCTLGRIDLCYLRLLENYESIYGKGSCFATVLLLCKKRRFEQGVLNVDNHVHYLILCPYLSGGKAGGYVKPALNYCTSENCNNIPPNDKQNSCAIANDVYPTLLPVHVANFLPAWLAGRALQNPPRKCTSTSLVGWKILGLELNIAASQIDQSGYGPGDLSYAKELPGVPTGYCPGALIERICQSTRGRRVAPHLDFLLLAMLILLYAECGNPRAIHLIAKLSERRRLIENIAVKLNSRTGLNIQKIFSTLDSQSSKIPFGMPVSPNFPMEEMSKATCKQVLSHWILERGQISKFVLLGDMIFRFTHISCPRLYEKVFLIYLSGEDLIRCLRVLKRMPQLKKKYEEPLEKLQMKYHLVKNGRPTKGNSSLGGSQLFGAGASAQGSGIFSAGSTMPLTYNKDERLKESLAIVKRLAIMDDVDGAIDFFYKLRNSEGGLLDISVGNKILHLCVINGKLKKAEEILNTLRNDAHCEINAIDFIPGSCVRPDVVTCNIIIKGMARERGGHARLQEIKNFILHMEKPFHLGGDGVKPDQVTFHAVINAAVNANDLPMAWELFNMMLMRNIKIDSFTCNLVAKQLSKGVAAMHGSSKLEAISEGNEDTNCTAAQLSNMISKFCAFVEQNDITNYDDNVSLLSNIIDMYSRKETPRLKRFLDNVSAKILSREVTNNGGASTRSYGEHRGVDAQEIAVLMAGYGKCAKAAKVNMLWKLIESGGKDVKWTTSIIGSCIEAFASIKDLNQVLILAEKARKLTQSSPSCRPLTAGQYSAIIRTCVAHQKQAEALSCYNLMKQYGLLPNEMAYNALIHSCVQAGDLATALGILNEMGLPNHQGRNGAENIGSNCQSPSALVPPSSSRVINSATASNNAVFPTATVSSGVGISPARPDIVTYSTIIKGLCDDGNMEAAYELFESLPAKGLIRDSVTYNTILEGYARAGDSDAVARVFSEMMTCPNNPCGPIPVSARPTCYTLTILVKFYGRKRQVDHVINLVEVLPSLGKFKLDNYVYTAVIAACAWNNRILEAYNYLLEMRSQFGCGSRTYGTLVSGCIKNCHTNILIKIIDLITQDKIRLDKREITALRDLLRQYNSQTLNPLWIHSGFNYDTAEAVRQLVTQQRRELTVVAKSCSAV